MTLVKGDVDCVADQIRKYFSAAKRERHGKPYNPSQKFKNPEFWKTAAEICVELKADSYSFVRAAFLHCGTPGGPFPTQLCGNAIRNWYKAYRELYVAPDGADPYTYEIQALILHAYNQGRLHAQAHNETIKHYLLDKFTRQDIVPAFVRLVLLPHDPDIFRAWSRIAYTELMCNQRLLTILQEKRYDLSFLEKAEREMRGI